MTIGSTDTADLHSRVRANQERLAAELRRTYDFIVCGAGASGSVVARRLAEDPAASVLLLEAGGSDDVPNVTEAALWPTNLGGERDWAFQTAPNPHFNGRALTLPMGKVLGGSTSINVMTWVRGHKTDWDYFASESGNDAWNYESVRNIYCGAEDWHGEGDPEYRGSGGPVFVERIKSTHPAHLAVIDAASSALGIGRFNHPNGEVMEGSGGIAPTDNIVRDGKRQSIFRSYTYPVMDRPNLTVLPNALVRRVTIDGRMATGVEVSLRGQPYEFVASTEVVLALGAMHTPKVLMLSGIGDESALRPFGIPVVQHLPGVGQNFQNHTAVTCMWDAPDWPSELLGDAIMFWSTQNGVDAPDCFAAMGAFPMASPENIARFGLPDSPWITFGAPTRPTSRGTIALTSADPEAPIRIAENGLSHPEDVALSLKCVENMRDVGNSVRLRPFLRREVMPGDLKGNDLLHYVRDGAMSFFHHVGTAKMGRDPLAVVDGSLRVHGIGRLRIADGSVMPRITVGNTMAPCVVIGERAAQELKSTHLLASKVMAT